MRNSFQEYPHQMELKMLLKRLQNGFRIGLFEKPEPKIITKKLTNNLTTKDRHNKSLYETLS